MYSSICNILSQPWFYLRDVDTGQAVAEGTVLVCWRDYIQGTMLLNDAMWQLCYIVLNEHHGSVLCAPCECTSYHRLCVQCSMMNIIFKFFISIFTFV